MGKLERYLFCDPGKNGIGLEGGLEASHPLEQLIVYYQQDPSIEIINMEHS